MNAALDAEQMSAMRLLTDARLRRNHLLTVEQIRMHHENTAKRPTDRDERTAETLQAQERHYLDEIVRRGIRVDPRAA